MMLNAPYLAQAASMPQPQPVAAPTPNEPPPNYVTTPSAMPERPAADTGSVLNTLFGFFQSEDDEEAAKQSQVQVPMRPEDPTKTVQVTPGAGAAALGIAPSGVEDPAKMNELGMQPAYSPGLQGQGQQQVQQPGMVSVPQTSEQQQFETRTQKGIEMPGVMEDIRQGEIFARKSFEELRRVENKFLNLYDEPELKAAIDQRQKMFGELKKAGLNRNAVLNEVADKLKAARDEFEKSKTIDPNRLWNKKNIGRTLLRSLGVILGGIGSGLTGRENLAAKIFHERINEDIALQKYEREQALADLQKQGEFMNQEAAIQDQMVEHYLRMYVNRSNNVQGVLEKIKGNTQTQRDIGKIDLLIGQLKDARAQAKIEVYKLMADKVVKSAATRKVNEQKMMSTKPSSKMIQQETKLRKEYQTEIKDFQTAINSYNAIEKLLKQDTGVANKAVIQKVAKLFDPSGRITDGDVRYWQKFGNKAVDAWLSFKSLVSSNLWTDVQKQQVLDTLAVIRDDAQSGMQRHNQFYTNLFTSYGIPTWKMNVQSPAGRPEKQKPGRGETK